MSQMPPKASKLRFGVLITINIIITVNLVTASLLFPASSLLQLTASLSVPVIDLPPQRRIGFDWGFQMNYDMPFDLASFYNAAIWPISQNRTKRASEAHHFDFSFLDFYRYLEQRLESFGYHKSCLLLCICELMQQPLEHQHLHFISELLHFLFRPTLHFENLRNHDLLDAKAYLQAEISGTQTESCVELYTTCDHSPLSLITKILNK